MPFVTQDHRNKPDWSIPGDRCYVHYKAMVTAWKKEPRWTTADKIHENVLRFTRDHVIEESNAMNLAWAQSQ